GYNVGCLDRAVALMLHLLAEFPSESSFQPPSAVCRATNPREELSVRLFEVDHEVATRASRWAGRQSFQPPYCK
ncbi:MAG: hypothetical protein ACK56I_05525, partial [bacterium]